MKKEKIEVGKDIQKKMKDFNTSGKIRYLHSLGYSQGDIARYLDKRPQHINNVLRTPVTKPVNTF